MRIISGRLRSRKIESVPGISVRPTPDRLRQTLFDVLAPRLAGAVFLDAYAGSGAVGIEAISRGAHHAIFIERMPQALAVLRTNLEKLKITGEATVIRGAAPVLLPNYPADIAFLDPPYDRPEEYVDALAALAGTACRLVIAQHDSKLSLDTNYGALTKFRVLKQGNNSLSFFESDSQHPS